MNILIGTISLNTFGGTETWTKTIYDELSKNNNVDVFSLKGYNAYPDINKFVPNKKYDIAFINHKSTYKALKGSLLGRKIVVVHGVIPKEETPVRGADAYVAVSEEIDTKYNDINMEIVRNPIDIKKYKPISTPNKEIKNVLFISNYKGYAKDIIKKTCKEHNLNFKHIGGRDNQVEDMVSQYNWADIVIGLGRSAYEAMSCGRNVIIFDYNGADGFATPETLLEYRKNNCSGRRYKCVYTVDKLWKTMQNYDVNMGDKLREYIIENNSVEKIAKQLLNV